MLESSQIEIYDSVTSTMDVARENVLSERVTFDADGTPNLRGVMAYEQIAGRGQRGRTWYAAKGDSLCVTYYIRHRIVLPEQPGYLALMAGVTVASQIRSLCHSHQLPVPALKWPNDVLLNGKKAGGILVEMVRAPDGQWAALAGVGLNVYVRDFPTELKTFATSLALESRNGNALPALTELAVSIGISLAGAAGSDYRSRQAGTIYNWKMYDSTKGRRYETDWNGDIVIGTAEGIDNNGALLLRLVNGERIVVTSASSLRELTEHEIPI